VLLGLVDIVIDVFVFADVMQIYSVAPYVMGEANVHLVAQRGMWCCS
jgi:hypothetical protein